MVDSQQAAPSMQGFGSADITTPFHYGSVHDRHLRGDSLEQKLRKQYWKTKQTVLQKLGKGQDEFIVAGDAEIDTKLEKAYHLQSSCTELLQAADKYMSRLRTVSVQESIMGEHLRTWSETEYTNAGEVMQNVGQLQNKDSKSRYQVIPPLMRMHREFLVFRGSAIRDLNESIQLLEKARTEYRAALLWMKDVSEKLHNPDYRDQLIRFREAQGAVKETKSRFEKLKTDLGEKIDMVSASRCNLLSRSLPNYQKEVLDYLDTVANEFHNLLVDLRTHHHHQYKVRRVLEEIRDLEADEMPFNDQPGMEDGDDFSKLELPDSDDHRPLFGGDDDPLLDLGVNGGGGGVGGKDGSETEKSGEAEGEEAGEQQEGNAKTQEQEAKLRRVGDPFSLEEVTEQAKVKDLVLGGIEAELQALQNEVLIPRDPALQGKTSTSPLPPAASASPVESSQASGQPKSQAEQEIEDLLKLDSDLPDDSTLLYELQQKEEESANQDTLASEWNNFSAFMPATREAGGSKSPLSGWEKELMGSPRGGSLPDPLAPSSSTGTAKSEASSSNDESPSAADDDASIDMLLGLSGTSGGGGAGADSTDLGGGVADELLSEELHSLGISPTKKVPVKSSSGSQDLPGSSTSTTSDISSIDSSMFGLHASLPPPSQQPSTAGSVNPMQPQQVPQFRSPLGTTQGPPVFPTQGAMGMVMAPPKFGLVGGPAQQQQQGQQAGGGARSQVGGATPGKGAKEGEKGKTWMNFFAHLDPLVNEKA